MELLNWVILVHGRTSVHSLLENCFSLYSCGDIMRLCLSVVETQQPRHCVGHQTLTSHQMFFVSGRRSCCGAVQPMKSDRRSKTTPNTLLTQISGRREHLLAPVILMGQKYSNTAQDSLRKENRDRLVLSWRERYGELRRQCPSNGVAKSYREAAAGSLWRIVDCGRYKPKLRSVLKHRILSQCRLDGSSRAMAIGDHPILGM